MLLTEAAPMFKFDDLTPYLWAVVGSGLLLSVVIASNRGKKHRGSDFIEHTGKTLDGAGTGPAALRRFLGNKWFQPK